MSAMAAHLPVVFLDGRPAERGRVSSYSPQENVVVVRGLASLMIALRRRGLEALLPPLAARHLRRHIPRGARTLFWSMDNWLKPEKYVRPDVLIHDCIDPCFSDDPDDCAAFEQRERATLQASGQVFATAEILVEKCRPLSPGVRLLNNACSPEEYSPALVESTQKPSWWPERMAPVVGCLSSLDWRVDFDMLAFACEQHPDHEFVFAGNIIPECREQAERLRRYPNATLPGRVDVAEGRYLLSRCAVGLIPYSVCAMNDAINPVKLYAYSLLGKPVVGTAIRELVSRPDIALTGRTPAEFSAAISCGLSLTSDESYVRRLQAFAFANTWENRAREAWEIIRHL